MALGVVVGLAYTPVMIHLLGQSEYGLYNTVSSTISMLSVLSLGFNASYIKFYSRYKRDENHDAIYRLNGFFLVIYSLMAIIALLCGLFLTNHLTLVFDEGLTSEEYEIAKVLMGLLTFNLALTFPMSVFSSIISAHEEFVFLKLFGIGKTVMSPLIMLPLLLLGYRSIAMVLVTILVSLTVDICYIIFVLKKLKQKFVIGKVDSELGKSIVIYTSFIAINMIVDQINWNLDKFLLGRYKGTEAVAIYSVGYSLYHYYQMFSTAISNVFTPRIHQIVTQTEDDIRARKDNITVLFTKVGRIQVLILGLVASGLVFFGKSFIVNIWAGKEYAESYVVMIVLVLSASIALIQNLGIEVQRAINKHQFRSIAYFFMALINLGLSIVLSQKYGAIGASIGTAISLLLANGLVMNIYYHKKCYINIIYFWKNIVHLLIGMIPAFAVGTLFQMVFDLNNLRYWGLGIVIYSIVYVVSVWFIAMNDYEKRLVRNTFRKLSNKRKKHERQI